MGRPERDGRSVVVDLPDASVSITPLTPWMVHIRSAPDRRWAPRRSWAVTKPDDAYPPIHVEVREGGDGTTIATPGLTTAVDAADGRLSVTAGARRLVADARVAPEPEGMCWRQRMPDGRRYFGFGERTGPLERRGRRHTCWTTDEWRRQDDSTDMLYVAIPFYLALDPDGSAHGLFVESTYRSVLDLTDPHGASLAMSAEAHALDWYVIDGPSPADVLTRFTDLVGRPPMPPRWALGYHQARWSYASDTEARAMADGLRAHAIPADAIHLDIDHMDGYRAFTWDVERFPDPARLVGDLADDGFRTTVVVDAPVTIEEPGTGGVYAEGQRIDAYVRTSSEAGAPPVTGILWGGPSVYPDHLRPDVRAWWGSLYRRYLDLGVAGFANDMNEPAMHDRPMDDPETRNIEPPPDAPFGPPGERVTHREARNVYALLEDEGSRAGVLRARPDARPFLITRSGFAGVQRHAIVWTGDNWSTWEHLAMSLRQLLNLGLSGVPVSGADIGGFFDDCSPELLVRWMQLGAFYPFARNNSATGTRRQEPWAFGEPTTSRCRGALELRYRLLPYLYSVAEEAARTGYPMLRPMWFHHPGDPDAVRVEDQAFVGRDLIIAPEMTAGATARDVYLPAGAWYDVRSGDRHEGPSRIHASATLDEELPLYARGGAVVPSGPSMAWSDERPVDPLTFDVYLDADGHADGLLYEDDGRSMAYVDGQHVVTRVSARRANGGTVVSAQRDGAFRPRPRTVIVRVHGPGGPGETRIADDDSWEVRL
ncbi:MAG TPA: glycoside hydrolase family 31 protein [Candidatus Limnocylindrales bacterium]